jgi:hypothetical protein
LAEKRSQRDVRDIRERKEKAASDERQQPNLTREQVHMQVGTFLTYAAGSGMQMHESISAA